jgi:hypothetical protein
MRVKFLFLLHDFNRNWNVSAHFNIIPNMTFLNNPFSDSRVVTYGGQADRRAHCIANWHIFMTFRRERVKHKQTAFDIRSFLRGGDPYCGLVSCDAVQYDAWFRMFVYFPENGGIMFDIENSSGLL